uniref:Secreted protein n=1 Tax=Trichogramma kaykai TaxID=54128 RepID=A0ABD2W4Z0_9HYME
MLLLLLLLPGRISFCSALVSQTLIRGHLHTTTIPIRGCTCRDQRPQVSFPCLAIPTAVSSKNFDTCGSLHKEPVCDLVLLLLLLYVLLFLQWETARVDAARRINLLNLQLCDKHLLVQSGRPKSGRERARSLPERR